MPVKRQLYQIVINVKQEEKFVNNVEIINLFRWIENRALLLVNKALAVEAISFAI